MAVFADDFVVRTQGENTFLDITDRIGKAISGSGIDVGSAHVFLLSTTSSLIICENEKGLIDDIIRKAKDFAPDSARYRHNEAWGDNNGRSHVKATLYRQDLTIPVRRGKPLLGTWQSILLLEFDLRARERRIAVTVTG